MAFAAVGGALVSSAIGGTWGAVAGAATSALIGGAVGGSSGGGSGSTTTTSTRKYDPFETRANDAAAAITRGTWDYAKQFYHPLENELIAKSSVVNENEVFRRGDLAQRGTEAAYQGNMRDLMRQGVTMSGQQRAYLDRMRQLGISTNRAFAQNTDRLNQLDRNRNTTAALTSFGRSSLSQADAAAQAAAGMETQRNVSGGYTDVSESVTKQKAAKSGGSI